MSFVEGDPFYLSRSWRAKCPKGFSVVLKADSVCRVSRVISADIESQHDVFEAESTCDGRIVFFTVPRIFCIAEANRYLLWLIEKHRARDEPVLYRNGLTVCDLEWPRHLQAWHANCKRILWQTGLGFSMIDRDFDIMAPERCTCLQQYNLILIEHIWGYKTVNGHSVGDAVDFHLQVLNHLTSICSSSLVILSFRAKCVRRLLDRLKNKGQSGIPRRWVILSSKAHYTPLMTASDHPVVNGSDSKLIVVQPLGTFRNWRSLQQKPVYIPEILFEACLREQKVLQVAAGRLDSTLSIAQALQHYKDVYALA